MNASDYPVAHDSPRILLQSCRRRN
jgi:hypothetical protein